MLTNHCGILNFFLLIFLFKYCVYKVVHSTSCSNIKIPNISVTFLPPMSQFSSHYPILTSQLAQTNLLHVACYNKIANEIIIKQTNKSQLMVIVISHNGVALDIVREFTELFGCWLRFSCYCFSLIDLDRFLCYFPIKCVMLYWAVKFGGVWPPSNVATCVRSLLNWAFCILEDMTCGSC